MSRLQTGLARAATIVSTICFLAWTLFQQFVFAVGATTVGDDYHQLVDERLPIWIMWLVQTPWWLPSLLATVATAFLIWFSWPRTATAVALDIDQKDKKSDSVSISTDKRSLEDLIYLDSAAVVGGSTNWRPEYRARFAKNGRNASFYVEYSAYTPGHGIGWTQRRVQLAFEKDRFVKGEDIRFPLFGSTQTREGERWHWEPLEMGQSGFPENMIGINYTYRGRIRFVADDDTTENCYFIVLTKHHSEMPQVIGEHMFAHTQEWEGEISRNGNPKSLFR